MSAFKRLKITPMRVLLIILLGIVIVTFIPMVFNPIRRPQKMVRNYILRLTPIGTHIDDVVKFIESKQEWTVLYINYKMGYAHLGEPIPGWPVITRTIPGSDGSITTRRTSIIGDKSIRAYLGEYYAWYTLGYHTAVSVFWCFDKGGKLIEVYVSKEIDII
ncbi:MAG: hypothetical protein LBB94_11610 [Clostridiales bacterium]|jgi:hypothetical protein|nr:hypothetical protein [Clostridiales bacterium]